jgi:hypothetical protein
VLFVCLLLLLLLLLLFLLFSLRVATPLYRMHICRCLSLRCRCATARKHVGPGVDVHAFVCLPCFIVDHEILVCACLCAPCASHHCPQGSYKYHEYQFVAGSRLVMNVTDTATDYDWLFYAQVLCDYDILFSYEVYCA